MDPVIVSALTILALSQPTTVAYINDHHVAIVQKAVPNGAWGLYDPRARMISLSPVTNDPAVLATILAHEGQHAVDIGTTLTTNRAGCEATENRAYASALQTWQAIEAGPDAPALDTPKDREFAWYIDATALLAPYMAHAECAPFPV